MDCHVFLCNSKRDAKELALGLGAAFEKAFLIKKENGLLSAFRSISYWEHQEAERESIVRKRRTRSLLNVLTPDSRISSLEKVYENADFLYEKMLMPEVKQA